MSRTAKHAPARKTRKRHDVMLLDDRRAGEARTVLDIRTRYAAAIIADGIFGDHAEWSEVVSAVAKAEADPYDRALQAWLEALEQRLPGASEMADPDQRGRTKAVSDVVCSLYSSYLDAGFFVGLAVGMQLGPTALDGLIAATRSKGGAK